MSFFVNNYQFNTTNDISNSIYGSYTSNTNNLQINLDDYQIIKNLNRGGFGKVSLVKNKSTDKLYAAKETINCDNDEKESLIKEINFYSKFKEKTIVQIHGYSLFNFSKKPFPTILLEYMPNGSLNDLFNKFRTISEIEFRNKFKSKLFIILIGIVHSLCFLHSKSIVHRDIKPENILIDDNFYPHICDFGTIWISKEDLLKKQRDEKVGTPLYLAPELILRNESYTYKTDVYSFALVAYELFTGIKPFSKYKTKSTLYNAIKKGERPDLSMIKDTEIQSFFQKCWSSEPSERPNFSEIFLFLNTKPLVGHYLEFNMIEYFNYMQNIGFDFDSPIFKAMKYQLGVGTERNNEKAFQYYKQSFFQGETDSSYYLNLFYATQGNIEMSNFFFA